MQKWILILMVGLAVLPSAAYAKVHDNRNAACRHEIQRGIASWYGPGFEGGRTQGNEPFDANSFSAAHQSLPFGSVVRVMNLRNYRSVLVRVNDRGSFGKKRVIDISQAAATKIGMLGQGVAPVAIYRCSQ